MPNPRAQQPLSYDQIVKDAKSLGVPAQALLDALAGGLKGSVTATLGAPADIYNLINNFSFRGQLPNLPYGSEDIAKMLPDVIPTQDKSRQHSGEYGEAMGSFLPTPMAGQAVKGAIKLGKAGAKVLGEEMGRRAVMGESFTPLMNTAMPMTHVIKPKGGNWLNGDVEKSVQGLKTNINAEKQLAQMRERYTPEALAQLPQDAREFVEQSFRQLESQNALNNWVDKNLSNYIRKEMSTPEDPVRKLAEQGIVHFSTNDPDYLTPRDIKNVLGKIRKQEGFPAKGMGKSPEAKGWENYSDNAINIQKAGEIQQAPSKFAEREQARIDMIKAHDELNQKFLNYLNEKDVNLTDEQKQSLVKSMRYDDKESLLGDYSFSKAWDRESKLYSPVLENNARIAQENSWINKVTPETSVYSANVYDLGFDHILDVLKEDVASGRLRPESLKNVSMEQAVRRTHEYDQEMAKKMEDAQAKRLEGMTLYKEYPEGFKWVQLDKPGQFASESEAMGHSVRGYEPPKGHPDWIPESGDSGSSGYGLGGWEAIKSGKAKIYSLVDPKGNPHTTIEVGKGSHPIGTSSRGYSFPHELTYGNYADPPVQIPEETRQQIYNLGKKLYFENPNAYAENRMLSGSGIPDTMESFQKAADILLGERPGYIKQIKGKSNASPDKKYLPFIQDFVKSGNWSDVGDLQNTGLIQHSGKYFTEPEFVEATKKYGRMGVQDTPWEVARQRHIEQGIPEQEALNNWVDAFKEGRGRLDIPPETPPVEGMKKGGAVTISDNPDTMFMELMDKKMKDGGAEDDTKASFGVFPQLKPHRTNQDPEASKDMPLQALRGRVAGTIGLPSDLLNLPLSVVNALANTDYQVPFGSEYFQKTLPLKPTSPAGEASSEVGSFFPSSTVLKAELMGLKGLGKIVGEGLANASMGEGPEFLKALVQQPKFAVEKTPKLSKKELIEQGYYHPFGGFTSFQNSGKKLEMPFNEMTSKRISNPDVNLHVGKKLTPEDLVKMKASGVPLIGDRADTGKLLTHINDIELRDPITNEAEAVPLTGGALYMSANYNKANPKNSAAWESGKSVVTKIGNQLKRAQEGDNPVLGVYSTGSPTQVDFNNMMSHALYNQLNFKELPKNLVKKFDAEIQKKYPDFPGIQSPEAKQMLLDKSKGGLRTLFVDRMSTDAYQGKGFPDVVATRKAISDPNLIDASLGDTGYAIANMDTNHRIIEKPLAPSGYPIAMAGKHLGGLKETIPFNKMFTRFENERRLFNAIPSSDYRSYELSNPIQKFDQEWLDKVGPYLENRKKTLGFKNGGEVNISDNPNDMLMEIMDKKMAGGGAVTKTLAKMAEEAPEMIPFLKGMFEKGEEGVHEMLKKVMGVPEVKAVKQGDVKVTERIPELQEASQKIGTSLTPEQYAELVEKHLPIRPLNFIPKPPTDEEAMNALNQAKRAKYGNAKDIQEGDLVGARLDIPAYTDNNTWVNSIHLKDKPTTYSTVSHIKNFTIPNFDEKALAVAQGGAKSPFAKMEGEWQKITPENAIAMAKELYSHPEWTQVGMDPRRAGYFYDRYTAQPVVSGEEALQIGPMVLVKNPKYGKKSDFKFAHGGAVSEDDIQMEVRPL